MGHTEGHDDERELPRPLPVSYRFLTGARTELMRRSDHERGTNHWDKKPSALRPVPVVLIHGTAGSAVTNWATLAPTLYNAGYSVFDLTYGAIPGAPWPLSQLGGLQELQKDSVPEVTKFVERVLDATGAPQVDLVGHSQGCVIAGALAKLELPGKVRKVVSLAGPWDGVGGEQLSWLLDATGTRALIRDASKMAADLVDGSDFLKKLYGKEGTPYAKDVEYTNIATRYDQFVVPYESALLKPPPDEGYSVKNIILQHGCMLDFVDHAALPSDPRAVDYVMQALDPTAKRQIRCLPTVPLLGGLLPAWMVDQHKAR